MAADGTKDGWGEQEGLRVLFNTNEVLFIAQVLALVAAGGTRDGWEVQAKQCRVSN